MERVNAYLIGNKIFTLIRKLLFAVNTSIFDKEYTIRTASYRYAPA